METAMTTSADTMRARFWRELSSLRTGMVGLAGRDTHAQPMTAHFDRPDGPVWFIARADSPLVSAARGGADVMFTYVGKGHDFYACVGGRLAEDKDRSVLDRYWTAEVSRWFADKGEAALLRFEPRDGHAWIPGESTDATDLSFQGQARSAA
jgi:general stress protein 26